MKCPECASANQKSIVYPGYGMSTCMGFTPYYDEDGKYHIHDPNISTIRYNDYPHIVQ